MPDGASFFDGTWNRIIKVGQKPLQAFNIGEHPISGEQNLLRFAQDIAIIFLLIQLFASIFAARSSRSAS
jgi:hypothetical protein